jgi:hypothetical protein
MKQLFSAIFFFMLLFAVSGFCVALNIENLVSQKNLQFSGFAALEEGQFVKGHHLTIRDDTTYGANGTEHFEPFLYPVWIHRVYARLKLETYIKERLHVIVSPEFRLWFDSYPSVDVSDQSQYPFRPRSDASIADGEGIYSFGDLNKPFLQIAAGIFPFKYNPDASNLGEYLFRTGCYPPYIVTSFDVSYVRLAGLRLSSDLFENLHQDLLLTTETQVQPLYDWSLSYLIGYKIPSLLDIGAGVNFNRLFPIADTLTTPKWPSNQYITSSGEQKYYSFSGIKLMGRVTIDPKGLLPKNATAIFGNEDCKLFAEAAVLGLTDIKAYKYRDPDNGDSTPVLDSLNNFYGDLKNRIPIMFGINVPTFKLLDEFSIQGELYSWPYVDALYYQTTQIRLTAKPPALYVKYSRDDYKKDNWKWSIYAKKTLMNHFSIIGQAARDHSHHDIYDQKFKDDNEVFTRNDEWGWWLKLQYNF